MANIFPYIALVYFSIAFVRGIFAMWWIIELYYVAKKCHGSWYSKTSVFDYNFNPLRWSIWTPTQYRRFVENKTRT